MNRFYLPESFLYPTNYRIPKHDELKNNTSNPETNSQCYHFEVSNYKAPTDFLPFYSKIKQTTEGLFILATNNYTTCLYDSLIGATYDFNDIVTGNSSNLKFKTLHKENIYNLHCLEDTIFLASTSHNSIELFSTKALKTLEQQNHRDSFCLFKISRNITDGCASSLCTLKDDHRFIVGTNKGNIECYEYNSMEVQIIFSIPYAHSLEITGLSSHPSIINNWASSSSDKSLLLWDRRLLNPAMALLSDHRDRLTDVHWLNEETLITCDSAGNLILLDSRKPKMIQQIKEVSNRTINSLCFHQNNSKFGIVSESCRVSIYEITNNKEFELLHEHNARPNTAYSMCWDVNEKLNTFYVVGDNKYAEAITLADKLS